MTKYHFDLTGIAIHDDKEISAMDGAFDTESNVHFDLDGLSTKAVRDRAHEMFDRLLDKILPKDESPKERIEKNDPISDKEMKMLKKYFENLFRRYGDDVPEQVLTAYILATFGTDPKKKDGECESPCDECCCPYQEAEEEK